MYARKIQLLGAPTFIVVGTVDASSLDSPEKPFTQPFYVHTKTVDAGRVDEKGVHRSSGGNPLTTLLYRGRTPAGEFVPGWRFGLVSFPGAICRPLRLENAEVGETLSPKPAEHVQEPVRE